LTDRAFKSYNFQANRDFMLIALTIWLRFIVSNFRILFMEKLLPWQNSIRLLWAL